MEPTKGLELPPAEDGSVTPSRTKRKVLRPSQDPDLVGVPAAGEEIWPTTSTIGRAPRTAKEDHQRGILQMKDSLMRKPTQDIGWIIVLYSLMVAMNYAAVCEKEKNQWWGNSRRIDVGGALSDASGDSEEGEDPNETQEPEGQSRQGQKKFFSRTFCK